MTDDTSRRGAAEPTGEAEGPQPQGRKAKRSRKPGKRTVPGDAQPRKLSPTQRLLILDSWQRSGLPAKDFSPLVGLSDAWLYKWRRRFEQHGPAGLEDKLRGVPSGSKLDEVTRRAILLTKEVHPDWGQDRIFHELQRTEALRASPGAIAKVLEEEGFVVEEVKKPSHPDKPRRFERAKPNQLWQTDLFTFTLKRQNRRVHLIGFMDDHSRFVVGFGLYERRRYLTVGCSGPRCESGNVVAVRVSRSTW